MTDNLFAFTRAAAAHLADGGLFRLDAERALVGRTAGAGARAALAAACETYDGLASDVVARLVNAIVGAGAEPLFVLARLSGSGVDGAPVERLVQELHRACAANACALVAADASEAPDVYADGRFDLTAGIVGMLELAKAPDVDSVRSGDALVGLLDPSLSAPGCARLLSRARGEAIDAELRQLAGTLLVPQPSYHAAVHAIRAAATVRSMAYVEHDLFRDVPRALPENVAGVFEPARWDVPPAIDALVRRAQLDHEGRFRALAMGIGLVLVVPLTEIAKTLAAAPDARVVGFVQPRRAGDPAVVVRAPRAPR